MALSITNITQRLHFILSFLPVLIFVRKNFFPP